MKSSSARVHRLLFIFSDEIYEKQICPSENESSMPETVIRCQLINFVSFATDIHHSTFT